VRRADGRLSDGVLPDKDTAISILKFGDDLPNLAGTASYFATSLAACGIGFALSSSSE
jgi:hypothetical protein